jgi:hypothetical protein
MRKIIDKSPNRLIDREFNIPVFNADTQMYVCMDVSEIASSPVGKDYTISFSEVKQKYAVPQRINIDLFIPTTDANGELAHVHMVEPTPKRGNIELASVMVNKSKLSSLAGLKEVFYNMAKKM